LDSLCRHRCSAVPTSSSSEADTIPWAAGDGNPGKRNVATLESYRSSWPIVSIKSDTSDNTLISRIAPDNVRLMCLHASIVGAPRPSLYRHTSTDGSGECRDVQPQPSSFRSGSCDRRVLQPVAVNPYDLVVLIGGKPVEAQFEARPTSNQACPRNPARQSHRFRADLAVAPPQAGDIACV